MLEVETKGGGGAAVPVKLTVCGLLPALSVRVTVPLTVPTVAGAVNVTLIVQVPAAARLEPQLLV
jgi:hypothetical protein